MKFHHFLLITLTVLISACTQEEKDNTSKEEKAAKETPKKAYKSISDDAVISVGVKDLEESKAFWLQMGFEVVDYGSEPDPWVLLTDQSIYLSLNEDGGYYLGYLMYQPNFDAFLDTLDSDIPQQTREITGAMMHLFISPDSNSLGVVETPKTDNIQSEKLVNYMKFVQEGNFGLEGVELPNQKLGVFGELTYPVKNIQESIAFWQKMSFTKDELMQSPYPFAIMYDGQHVIGLHETDLFSQPGLTYFASDQSKMIQSFKDQGFKTVEYMPGMEDQNVIIQSPNGYNVFMFSAGL